MIAFVFYESFNQLFYVIHYEFFLDWQYQFLYFLYPLNILWFFSIIFIGVIPGIQAIWTICKAIETASGEASFFRRTLAAIFFAMSLNFFAMVFLPLDAI